MKRRQGASVDSYLRSRHLLVTNNDMLATVAQKICRELGFRKSSVPPVVHRRRISAAVWLQFGSAKRQAIARKQLIASCSDVLRVRPEIIDQMRARLEKIDPQKASQFDILINQPRYQQLAMDLTFANEAVADRTDVVALYERL
jgi:hypothetical protein